MNFACIDASVMVRTFLSSGQVWIHPTGSKPFRNSDYGICVGITNPSLLATWGTTTIHRISLTNPSTTTPYKYPNTCTLRSAIETNFFNRFLGRIKVYALSLTSSVFIHILFVLINIFVADNARNLQSVCDLNAACS